MENQRFPFILFCKYKGVKLIIPNEHSGYILIK